MLIVGIVGSHRRGNTYAMVEAGCHAMKDSDVELIHIKDLKIEFCDGCLQCDETGECHIQDGMKDIIPLLKEADGFIIGTPSRWSLLSGELKVFIDRLNPLAIPELLSGKKAIIFSVGQSTGDDKLTIVQAAESVKFFCDNAGIEVIEEVVAEDCLEPNDLIAKHPKMLDVCRDAAMKLYSNINE